MIRLNLWQFAAKRERETLIGLDPQGEADHRAYDRIHQKQLHELDDRAIALAGYIVKCPVRPKDAGQRRLSPIGNENTCFKRAQYALTCWLNWLLRTAGRWYA